MDHPFHYLKINYTSVVYPLTVLILPISSLLIYLVSYLIVLDMLSFVIGYVQIVEFRFELLSDMTVVPQQYTLHCVIIGDDNSYTITLYGNDQQRYSGGCGNGNCIKHLLPAVTLHMIIL